MPTHPTPTESGMLHACELFDRLLGSIFLHQPLGLAVATHVRLLHKGICGAPSSCDGEKPPAACIWCPIRSLRRLTASSFLFSAREITNDQVCRSVFGRNIRISRMSVWTARCPGCVDSV